MFMKKWLQNFWFYYKWHTIAVIFAAIVITVTVALCASKPKNDYTIIVAMKDTALTEAQVDVITEELSKYGEDVNGDGEINVGSINCTFLETSEDINYVISMRQKLQITAMGEASAILYITDEDTFSYVDDIKKDTGGFFVDAELPLKDGKAFSFKDTEFMEKLKATGSNVPDEIYISKRIIKGTIIEGDSKIEQYEKQNDKFLKAIVDGVK